MAVQQVQRDLILDAVAEAHGLKATEADLDQRIAALAAARNLPTGELYASLQKSNRLPELERAITEEKVFGHLLSQSTVEEAST
jgi:FKBP-type peptidyl-prolyl cis-trans isomerase (trigger factor)